MNIPDCLMLFPFIEFYLNRNHIFLELPCDFPHFCEHKLMIRVQKNSSPDANQAEKFILGFDFPNPFRDTTFWNNNYNDCCCYWFCERVQQYFLNVNSCVGSSAFHLSPSKVIISPNWVAFSGDGYIGSIIRLQSQRHQKEK